MATPRLTMARLQRVFMENFSVGDIAEPLASFDAAAAAADVRTIMAARGYRVAGVRREGTIAGYVQQEELAGGTCGDYLHPFNALETVPDSANLPAVVVKLAQSPRLFVTAFGQIGGIVTRTDLQKPPVRMWLFGMITIIEMGLTQMIEERFADGGWRQFVSESRLAKAETLLAERARRNQAVGLLDCLQLADKGQVVLRNEDMRVAAGFVSRSKGTQTMKEIEALRNNLAHSQDIVTCDWDIIVKLTTYLDTILRDAP
jgi:hypothetical protein